MSYPDIITIGTTPPAAGRQFLAACRQQPPYFLCTIATTETAAIPGISAAGANAELIRYTAAADVEAIYYGTARCLEKIPENPKGPPSPVIITMAAREILQCPLLVVDAGNAVTPQVPLLVAGRQPGKAITTPLPVENARELFLQGIIIGESLGQLRHTLIIGESVPGGTTTALSLLEALGIEAFGKVSGSMPGNNPQLKKEVVNRALEEKGLVRGSLRSDPLAAVALLGDPMQIVQAGMALAASRECKIILGGGTQMIAVAALIGALLQEPHLESLPEMHRSRCRSAVDRAQPENLAIATTSWVSEDENADIPGLLARLPVPVMMFAARLNFAASRHQNLRLYEEGFVKEGVGAGALALAAMLYRGLDSRALLPAIEAVYERIYLAG